VWRGKFNLVKKNLETMSLKDFYKQIEDAFFAKKFLTIRNLCNMEPDGGRDRFSTSFKIALAHFVLAGGLAVKHDKAMMSRAQEFIAAAIGLSSIISVGDEDYENALALSILIDFAMTRDFDGARDEIVKAQKDNNHGRINPVWEFINTLIYFYSGDIIAAKQSAQKALKEASGNVQALAAINWFLSLISEKSPYAQSAFESLRLLVPPSNCLWLLFINDEDIKLMMG